MKLQDKNAWLPETVEDMIIFCKNNGLSRSRAILHEAHQVMMSEIIVETYLEELNQATRNQATGGINHKGHR